MKKLIGLIAVGLVLASVSPIFADFRPDVRPVWGMLNDTAYTLKGDEWNLDLWGPISYGIIDQVQVGTMFWVWFAQAPNVNAKVNIIPESDGMPAISVGGSYYNFSVTVTDPTPEHKISIRWYGLEGLVAKQLTSAITLAASYKYNGVNTSEPITEDQSQILKFIGVASDNQAVFSFIADMNKMTRFTAEVVGHFGGTNQYDAGGGFEWALGDTFRLKLGIDVFIRPDTPIYFPFVDLHWRFK